jgi:hypothetical protein
MCGNYDNYFSSAKEWNMRVSQPAVDQSSRKLRSDVISLENGDPLTDKELHDLSLESMALLIDDSQKLNKLGILLTRLINTIKAKPQPEIEDGYVVVPADKLTGDDCDRFGLSRHEVSLACNTEKAMIKAAQGEG